MTRLPFGARYTPEKYFYNYMFRNPNGNLIFAPMSAGTIQMDARLRLPTQALGPVSTEDGYKGVLTHCWNPHNKVGSQLLFPYVTEAGENFIRTLPNQTVRHGLVHPRDLGRLLHALRDAVNVHLGNVGLKQDATPAEIRKQDMATMAATTQMTWS